MHPDPTDLDLDLMRWLDGQMPATEAAAFEQRMTAQPELLAEMELQQQLSHSIKASFATPALRNEDFFNHQIQQAIAAEQPKQSTLAEPVGLSIWQWLRSPWALAGATAVLAAVFAVWPNAKVSQIVGSYAPNPGIQVSSYHDAAAGATVLVLEGLTEIPSGQPLVGYNIQHSERGADLAQTTLYDAEGAIVAVVAENSQSQPIVITR